MRVCALTFCTVLALVASAAVAAAADDTDEPDEDEEDAAFVAFPARSIALRFTGHGTRIGGRSETGVGSSLELALGSRRWQYFVEGGIASAGIFMPDGARVGGRMLDGGLGARWLARQFRPESGGGVELFLQALAGAQRYFLERTARLTRPVLAFGFGLQGRLYRRPRLAFRIDARLLFTPSGREDALVACGSRCMAEAGSSTGFSAGVGIAW
jgi:hypothetical protein